MKKTTPSDEAVRIEEARLRAVYAGRFSEEEMRKRAGMIREQAQRIARVRAALLSEARRRGMEASPVEVEDEIDNLRRACGSEDAFQRHLSRLRMSIADVRERIVEAKIVEALARQIASDIQDPTDREVEEFFAANPMLFATPERARVRHILVRADMHDAVCRSRALAKAKALRSRLDAGADFDVLAAECSDCPSGSRSGGEIEPLVRSAFPTEFEDAAFALKPGEIAGPVEAEDGFHIVLKIEHIRGGPAPLDSVRDDVRRRLRAEAEARAIDRFIESLPDD